MLSDEQLRGGATAPPRKVLILGVGNILLSDDGFGVHLINSLADTPFPPNVQVLEAGTVSHQLIPLFRELDHLIIIDVVEAGDTPALSVLTRKTCSSRKSRWCRCTRSA